MMTYQRKPGKKRSTLGLVLAGAVFGLALSASNATARDITLGGSHEDQQEGHSENEIMAKLPSDVVALPRLMASVQDSTTGRWSRVIVEAYLQSTNIITLSQVKRRVKDIAILARPQLGARPAETLGNAKIGMREAKDCIRNAVEESLGHDWSGNIYIRSLAVF